MTVWALGCAAVLQQGATWSCCNGPMDRDALAWVCTIHCALLISAVASNVSDITRMLITPCDDSGRSGDVVV